MTNVILSNVPCGTLKSGLACEVSTVMVGGGQEQYRAPVSHFLSGGGR